MFQLPCQRPSILAAQRAAQRRILRVRQKDHHHARLLPFYLAVRGLGTTALMPPSPPTHTVPGQGRASQELRSPAPGLHPVLHSLRCSLEISPMTHSQAPPKLQYLYLPSLAPTAALHFPSRNTQQMCCTFHSIGTSLAVQWLRLHALNAGDIGSIPGWGTKIPHAA